MSVNLVTAEMALDNFRNGGSRTVSGGCQPDERKLRFVPGGSPDGSGKVPQVTVYDGDGIVGEYRDGAWVHIRLPDEPVVVG